MSERTRRIVAVVLVAALVLGTVALAFSAVADAAPSHGPVGEMTVTKAEATGPTAVRIEAGLVYANDDELATGATVTATLTGPGGATVGPVPLSRLDEDSSLYGADVTVPQPGTWSVALTSTEPAATATGAVEVAPATTTTATTTTTTAATTTTSEPPATTSEPLTSEVADESDEDDGDGNGLLIAALVAAGVVVGGGLAWWIGTGRAGRKGTP